MLFLYCEQAKERVINQETTSLKASSPIGVISFDTMFTETNLVNTHI